jgi:hypothetical protein
MPFFRGATGAADFRYRDKHAALLKKISAPEFGTAVAMSKVKLPPIERWLARKMTELLGRGFPTHSFSHAFLRMYCRMPLLRGFEGSVFL